MLQHQKKQSKEYTDRLIKEEHRTGEHSQETKRNDRTEEVTGLEQKTET